MSLRFAAMDVHLADGEKKLLPACLRVLFVRSGSIRVSSGEVNQDLDSSACLLFSSAITLTGPGECWLFELSAHGGDGIWSPEEQSRLVFSTRIDRIPGSDVLIRADRVDFPPGTVTPRHGHKGPGIRRLIEGRLLAEVGNKTFRINAGDAWFEAGPDPVVGRTLAPQSAFIRVMVLDPALKNMQTFFACSPEDEIKPRGTQRTLFFDTLVKQPTR